MLEIDDDDDDDDDDDLILINSLIMKTNSDYSLSQKLFPHNHPQHHNLFTGISKVESI